MKPFFLLLYWLLVLTLSGSAQPGSRMKSQKDNAATPGTSDLLILVYDKSSSTRLEAAQVAVRQLGFQTKPSAMDGKVLFKNVPVGEVKVTIEKRGYDRIDTLFTVSARIEDNTYTVFLPPEKKVNNSLMISGEVEDERGRDVKGAVVEVGIGEYNASVVTDESGSYKFIINLDKVEYDIPEIRFEVKKNGCNLKDKIALPKSNYISKSVRLICRDEAVNIPNNTKSNGAEKNNTGSVAAKGNTEQELDGFSIKLLSAKYSDGTIVCNFQLENISEDYEEISLKMYGHSRGSVMGSNGIQYSHSYTSIAGSGYENYQMMYATLYKKAPVKMSIVYDGRNKARIDLITVLAQQMTINGNDCIIKMKDIKCSN